MSALQPVLRAKSADRRFSPEALSLAGHSQRVGEAAEVLCSALREDLRRFFHFDDEQLDCLQRLLPVAGLVHDLGKSSDMFQDLLAGHGRRVRQPFHHEWVSVALLSGDTPLMNAIRATCTPGERGLVSVWVAAHHLRDESANGGTRRSSEQLTLLTNHPSLQPVWDRLASVLGLEISGWPAAVWTPEMFEDLINFEYGILAGEALDQAPDALRRLVGVGKALLIAADILGSAWHDDSVTIGDVIRDRVSVRLDSMELQRVVASRLAGNPPRPFQDQVAASMARVTLVTAGCGNGKTIAAYMWGRHHAAGRSLVFCYPTTGTTSAGFEDYLLAQTELERRLLHSRARVDVRGFLRSVDDGGLGIWAPDVLDRWGTQVAACTVDTVLGFLTHWRTALASMPLWARSAFVFDEVHSYDEKLFGALLTFLSRTRPPVLLMTASLSPARLAAIREAVEHPLQPIGGAAELEDAARYRLEPADPADALALVVASVREGQRVLWVTNTVARAVDAYRVLRGELGDSCRVYHSRFRYRDRVGRQQEILAAFRSDRGAAVVATQVCEMSLDISADLLISEVCPFPSLVQRLGRLNRHPALPASSKPARILEVESRLPYMDADLDACRDTLAGLWRRDLSQRDLADALSRLHGHVPIPRRLGFFDDTVHTSEQPLREASPGITVLRRADLRGIRRPIPADQRVALAIPMPPVPKRFGEASATWKRHRGLAEVPDSALVYDPQEGAAWAS